MNGQLDNLEIVLCRTKDPIVIAPAVNIAEVVSRRQDLFIILSHDYFGATQGVCNPLLQEEGKDDGERFVPNDVGRSHGIPRKRIDHAGTVNKLSFVFRDRMKEHGKIFGHHRHVGVQNHEHVAGGMGKSSSDCGGLASTWARNKFNASIWMSSNRLANSLDGCVRAIVIDENNLRECPHLWDTRRERGNVVLLILARHDHSTRICLWGLW